MKGSEAQLLGFMEGANNRYIIPVYQRKYDWKIDNCRQLYEDLKKVSRDGRSSHFFGSIVSQVVPDGSKIEFHIIDGQQRLTTVTLLLLAICNMVKAGRVKSDEEALDDQILERFIIAKWAKGDDRIKLRPVKNDRSALEKLVAGDPVEFEPASNMTINYRFFCDQLLKEEISVDALYEAIGKLQIISITLDGDDKAQLIFESLNSTGLALTEGDKIRNYILMGLDPKKQDEIYDKYWTKIEECTGNDVSAFVRDYLSIKQQVTPTISNVYQSFKKYVETECIPLSSLLDDMRKYARIYKKLMTGKSGLNSQELDDCMYRLNRLEITVTEPFFMEILRLNQDGEKLSVDDLTQIFLITENYLFRRNICDVPTNALNKIFLNLNREVIRYDNTTNDYVHKFIYALLSKKESGRFPDDDEFSQALATKAVYQMRGKYKAYLFERFENYGTLEAKDVYTLLDNGTYSIEHIMPQHLTPAWIQELGPEAEEIHATWLHRLGNLTLTAYNSNMSNATFQEKRDTELGYKKSGLRMNQRIATMDHWGPEEMQERSDGMVDTATNKIWVMPSTTFVPVEKEFDSCALDDEDFDLKGRDIIKYSYQNSETPVSSWADMFEHVIKYLHAEDKSILSTLAYSTSSETELSGYFSSTPEELRVPLKIDDDVYVEKNTSTALKISILRRIFVLFHADPMDLVFYLRDSEQDKAADQNRFDLRRRYWTYALPIIQEANRGNGSFRNCSPSTSNTMNGYFGIGGFCVSCAANRDGARIDFYLGKGNTDENKKAFDYLKSRQDEIEDGIGDVLSWNRADDYKASWISYSLKDVSIANEADWPRMAKFMAEWSKKYLDVILPILEERYGGYDPDDQKKQTIFDMATKWVQAKADEGLLEADFKHSSRSAIRFKTQQMSVLFPDTEQISDWGTRNHYFFEIQNKTGHSAYIQMCLNSKNLTADEKAFYERAIECSNSRTSVNGWVWRTIFRSETVDFEENLSEQDVAEKLDTAFEDIIQKQDEFLKRMKLSDDLLQQIKAIKN
ncbi:MAG: DUF4268 domain-containing protein [Lachnospiraceae bacterium]|nr:MAG: DUF4268 domain-containing protein [Lachnospiraceae bacterium]